MIQGAECGKKQKKPQIINYSLNKKITQTDYNQQYNTVINMLHWNICKSCQEPAIGGNIELKKKLLDEQVQVFWDF